MLKLMLSASIFMAALHAFADTSPSPMPSVPKANVSVERVDGSKFIKAEKWVDKTRGVVCYAVEDDQENARSAAISCVGAPK